MHRAGRIDDVQKSLERSFQQLKKKWCKRKERGQRVGQRIKNDNWERQRDQVLLVLNFLIDADENFKVGFRRGLQEQAVRESLPAHFSCGADLMTGDVATKSLWQIVIEKNFQIASRSLSKSLLARSRTANACSRSTPSKSSRNSSRVSPTPR